MEQRIDPNIKPDLTVGTDPAYVPGLIGPPVAGQTNTAKDTEPKDVRPADETEPEDAPPSPDYASADVPLREDVVSPTREDAPSTADNDDEADAKNSEDAEDAEAGPVFQAADRRGSITLDRKGVRFRLDDEEADFDWAEIGAVEVDTPRFSRRFEVTVHLATRRFEAEVEAPSRNVLKQWAEELDAVLDAYFED